MQPFLQKYGKRVLIPGIVCIIGIIYFFFPQNNSASPTINLIETIPIEETTQQQQIEVLTEETVTQPIIVDVKGAIHYPGVYELTEDDRIIDLIELAGGYTENANPQLINHAQKLQDEMVIYIPRQGEELTEAMQTLVQVASVSPSGAIGSTNGSSKVNINKADEAALVTLPGVGPAKAQAILTYRTEVGSFQTIEDLKKVSGIGEKSFEQLKDLIDVK
ncbi:helix-hairpin-helix domain-containing protein [Solibacillus sp. FSL H8-0538]|uniref:helix-hairpin-helix domain-containing protein n=1 Tax=Solibacillus sp. FSL H8-0538 TaxID=2921400 RepID=UPI0030FC48D3